MKKLIQLALVIILVTVLFQAVAAGSMASASRGSSSIVSGRHLTQATHTADVYAASCFVYIKGVVCAIPNVGWNT